MSYNKDIFDYRNLPQSIKAKLQLDLEPSDIFRDKIYTLFSLAKQQNINRLNENQIAVAYYRKYTTKDSKDIKTVDQIRAKLRSMISSEAAYKMKHPDSTIKTLKRVENEKETACDARAACDSCRAAGRHDLGAGDSGGGAVGVCDNFFPAAAGDRDRSGTCDEGGLHLFACRNSGGWTAVLEF